MQTASRHSTKFVLLFCNLHTASIQPPYSPLVRADGAASDYERCLLKFLILEALDLSAVSTSVWSHPHSASKRSEVIDEHQIVFR